MREFHILDLYSLYFEKNGGSAATASAFRGGHFAYVQHPGQESTLTELHPGPQDPRLHCQTRKYVTEFLYLTFVTIK